MSDCFSRHYRVKDLAAMWGLCANTVRKMFADEPGVLKFECLSAKSKHVTLSIPESVALRVHERISHKVLQSNLATGNKLRVVHLRDLDGGMTQKPRNIIKLKAA